MDPTRFDQLTRALTDRRPSRRSLFGVLAGAAVAAGFAAGEETVAKPKRCPKGKKRCGRKCIPIAKCCTAADCGEGETCTKGVCTGGGGGGTPPDQCPVVSTCNAEPNACGRNAENTEDCICLRAVDGNTICVNPVETCQGLKPCTSTNGPEETSCRNLRGFHWFCQEQAFDAQGRACGCGQVCVPECDNRA